MVICLIHLMIDLQQHMITNSDQSVSKSMQVGSNSKDHKIEMHRLHTLFSLLAISISINYYCHQVGIFGKTAIMSVQPVKINTESKICAETFLSCQFLV